MFEKVMNYSKICFFYTSYSLLCVLGWWPFSSVNWFSFTSTHRVRTRWCLTDQRKRCVLARKKTAIIDVTLLGRNDTVNESEKGGCMKKWRKCWIWHHYQSCLFSLHLPLLLSQISPLLTSEVHSVRAGRHLATKLNILVQQHFDLASTTITNIPMKVRHLLLFVWPCTHFSKI